MSDEEFEVDENNGFAAWALLSGAVDRIGLKVGSGLNALRRNFRKRYKHTEDSFLKWLRQSQKQSVLSSAQKSASQINDIEEQDLSPVGQVVANRSIGNAWKRNAAVAAVCAVTAQATRIGKDMLHIEPGEIIDKIYGKAWAKQLSEGLGLAVINGDFDTVYGDHDLHHDGAVT